MRRPRAFACGPGLAIRNDMPSLASESILEVNFPRDLQSRAGAVFELGPGTEPRVIFEPA